MSFFREEDLPLPQIFLKNVVLQQNQQQSDFRYVRLIPTDERCNQVDLKTDWFNHEKYIATTEKNLKTIKPPQISSRNSSTQHQVVINVDEEVKNSDYSSRNSNNNSSFQKPSLIQKQVQNYRSIKLEVKKFQNTKYDQPEELVNVLSNVDSMLTTRISLNSDENIQSLDTYSKSSIRNKLENSLKQVSTLPDLESRYEKANMFKNLNERKLFAKDLTLEFAQLYSMVPYIQKSNLTGSNFFALLVNNQSRINQAAEFIIFNLILKQETDVDYPCLFTLALDQDQKKADEEIDFGNALNQIQSIDKTKVVVNLNKEIEEMGEIKKYNLNKTQVQNVIKLIDEETEFGVMLYFGGLYQEQMDERRYRTQLLQHIILALKSIQAKGYLILELKDSLTNFTTQFLVCSEILKAKPTKVINYLQELYDKLLQLTEKESNLKFEFGDLIDQNILKSEEKFLKYIIITNEAIQIYRHQFIENIIEDVDMPEKLVQDIKLDLIKKWDLTAEKSSGPKNQKDEILHQQFDLSNPRFTQSYNARSTQKHQQDNQSTYQHQGGSNAPTRKFQQSSYQQQIDEVKQPTEQERVNRSKIADREQDELLKSIIGTKEEERRKQEAERRRKELKERQNQQKQQEIDEKERQMQILQEKLNKLKGGQKKDDKKPAAQSTTTKSNSESKPIRISASSTNQGDEQSQSMRKRDKKANDKSDYYVSQTDNKMNSNGSGQNQNGSSVSIRIPNSVATKPQNESNNNLKRAKVTDDQTHQEEISRPKKRIALAEDYVQHNKSIEQPKTQVGNVINYKSEENGGERSQKMEIDQQNNQTKLPEVNDEDKRRQDIQRKIEENRKIEEEKKLKLLQSNPALQALLNKNKANQKINDK